MNMSRARGPRYSLEYLTFVATKRGNSRRLVVEIGKKEPKMTGRVVVLPVRNDLKWLLLL